MINIYLCNFVFYSCISFVFYESNFFDYS